MSSTDGRGDGQREKVNPTSFGGGITIIDVIQYAKRYIILLCCYTDVLDKNNFSLLAINSK